MSATKRPNTLGFAVGDLAIYHKYYYEKKCVHILDMRMLTLEEVYKYGFRQSNRFAVCVRDLITGEVFWTRVSYLLPALMKNKAQFDALGIESSVVARFVRYNAKSEAGSYQMRLHSPVDLAHLELFAGGQLNA